MSPCASRFSKSSCEVKNCFWGSDGPCSSTAIECPVKSKTLDDVSFWILVGLIVLFIVVGIIFAVFVLPKGKKWAGLCKFLGHVWAAVLDARTMDN